MGNGTITLNQFWRVGVNLA